MDCIFILGIVCSNIHNISCKKTKSICISSNFIFEAIAFIIFKGLFSSSEK